MVCKNCNSNIADGSLFCPVCGQKQEVAPAPYPDHLPDPAVHNPMTGNLGWGVPGDLGEEQPAPARPVEVPARQPDQPYWSDATTVLNDNSGQPQWNDATTVLNDNPTQPHWSDATTVLNENPYQRPVSDPYRQPVADPFRQPVQPDPSAPVTPCPQCGNIIARRPLGAQSCEYCGWNDYRPYRETGAPEPKPKSGKMIGIIVGAVAALLVLIVVLAGVFTNWFGLTGPVMTVSSAAKNTFSGGNFTMEFNMDAAYESVEGVAYVDLDVKNRKLNLLMELEVYGEQGTLAIYDDYLIMESDGDYQYGDISDELDDFFDTLEESGSSELDWEEIIDTFDPYAYEELEEYIDFDKLNECLTAYVKQANDAGWLKENAGYRTEKRDGATLHILEPEFSVLLPTALSYFEDTFYDQDDYEDIAENLEEIADEMDDYIQGSVAFGVKGGKLVSLDLVIDADGEEVSVEYTFSDIGTTRLDEDELADMLEEAMN